MPDTYENLVTWARANWPGGDPGPLQDEPMPADGSARIFTRLTAGGRTLVGLANPDNPPENRAWHHLAKVLHGLGVPTAKVLAADHGQGRFLMEDLGKATLQDRALACGDDEQALARLYDPVLAMLARIQARAAQCVDTDVCFDGADLSPAFLREREAGYFYNEFVLGACGLTQAQLPDGLSKELDALSRLAGQARPRGFVHRDFQSRNIIYENGRLGLVDFQGGRLGPAQYDLAALLLDPYVDMPWALRSQLRERYLDLRSREGDFDCQAFLSGYPYVCLSRVMQALGAYAFLTRKKGKAHFAQFAAPALRTLKRICSRPPIKEYKALGELVKGAPDDLRLG